MSDQRLFFIDIDSKSNSYTAAEGSAEKPIWTRSDNTFRFNFFPDGSAEPVEKSSPPDRTKPATSQISFTKQGSTFAFNFQIPPVTPVEDMETTETPDSSSPGSKNCVQEEKLTLPPEPTVQSKAKKKKKSRNKKALDGIESQQKSSKESQGGEDTELTAEEQLNRQLDWCIEQLELGMRSQNGTPKQKEEASRALRTLRSSKAPLAKKRQVMRAMTGDYRKKMEDEKSKQFKLIQSEIASTQVKAVSDSPKKSVFHRKVKVKSQVPGTEENLRQTEAQVTDLTPQTQAETSAFVFTPSKEVFHFNFL
ncbi:UPF0488 protein C8orf33 -like protein [Channa argus]|uniref:UPF0488 protein C8orf33-like protein n=1 Tax=Channa argus TaxID=215402 RepID=A0A6G1QR31_CHAAH|nr:UPF0488 protein C8orf33 -like protein [Channa argus]